MLDGLAPSIAELVRLNDVNPSSLAFHVGFVSGGLPTGDLLPQQRRRAVRMATAFSRLWGDGVVHGAQTSSLASRPARLDSLLEVYAIPCPVDMLDIDVQNDEYALLDESTVAMLTRIARRVHVGLHGAHRGEEVRRMVRLFRERGWQVTHLHPPASQHESGPWGRFETADGIASFVNPSLLCGWWSAPRFW